MHDDTRVEEQKRERERDKLGGGVGGVEYSDNCGMEYKPCVSLWNGAYVKRYQQHLECCPIRFHPSNGDQCQREIGTNARKMPNQKRNSSAMGKTNPYTTANSYTMRAYHLSKVLHDNRDKQTRGSIHPILLNWSSRYLVWLGSKRDVSYFRTLSHFLPSSILFLFSRRDAPLIVRAVTGVNTWAPSVRPIYNTPAGKQTIVCTQYSFN